MPAVSGTKVSEDGIPVYIHTARIVSVVDGCRFLLRYKSEHRKGEDALNHLLLVLGHQITHELSKQDTCLIASQIEHICTELSEMQEYLDYSKLKGTDTYALEDAYLDLMSDWELREEVVG